MGKKKAVGKFAVGQRIRVRHGVSSPEFPDVALDGWQGTVAEVNGKKPPVQYVIEWDAATLQQMPRTYIERCEAGGLFVGMALLNEEDLDGSG